MSCKGPKLFLDLDGVLNTNWFRKEFGQVMNPILVNNLATILNETGCNIVISSSWKFNMDEVIRCIKCSGFVESVPHEMIIERIIGSTLDLETREQEIMEWVNEHKVDNWVVIDDMLLDIENFVQTDDEVGLNEAKVKEVIEKFKERDNV